MPESAGPGDSVTRTVLPECSPTPSRLTAFRMVCCLMTAPRSSNRGATPSIDPNCVTSLAQLLTGREACLCLCPAEDTAPGALSLTFETLDVDDDLDLVAALAGLDRDAVQGRCLHHRAEAMAARVEGLAVQATVDHGVGARGDLDAAHHERLDLVHVEALVDPRGEERLRTVGLGAHLARLARGDRRRIGDQGEHAERRLSERLGARRTPGPDPDVGLDLELLVARIGFTHGGFGGPCRGPPSLLRACNSASRVCGGLGGHVGAPHLF